MAQETALKIAGIGDEAVHAKTGKHWEQWFKLLDKAGARKWGHTAIAAHLDEKLGCPGWWNQMVAVAYEQSRGLRAKHQRPSGYSVSRSKTIVVPIDRLYRAWQNSTARKRWLRDPLTVRKAAANKSLRITWGDGATSVEVNFYPQGAGKSQVTVQHSKLADAGQAERMKTFWSQTLERLKAELE